MDMPPPLNPQIIPKKKKKSPQDDSFLKEKKNVKVKQ